MEKIDIEKLMHNLEINPWVVVAEKVNEIIDKLEKLGS